VVSLCLVYVFSESINQDAKNMIPTRKISETILEFGEPVIEALSEDINKAEFESVMNIIVAVWNAVAIDAQNKNKNYEKELVKALLPGPIEIQNLANKLIQRKNECYSLDPRTVGKFSIIDKDGNGELIFRAESRLGVKILDAIGEIQ